MAVCRMNAFRNHQSTGFEVFSQIPASTCAVDSRGDARERVRRAEVDLAKVESVARPMLPSDESLPEETCESHSSLPRADCGRLARSRPRWSNQSPWR